MKLSNLYKSYRYAQEKCYNLRFTGHKVMNIGEISPK